MAIWNSVLFSFGLQRLFSYAYQENNGLYFSTSVVSYQVPTKTLVLLDTYTLDNMKMTSLALLEFNILKIPNIFFPLALLMS